MVATRALAPRPSASILAAAVAGGMPAYVDRDDVARILDAVPTTRYRLLIRALWQTGGRGSEVLTLRPCDVDRAEGALILPNLKQRRAARKRVYVSGELCADLLAFARELRIRADAPLFTGQKGDDRPITRGHLHRIVRDASILAGVLVVDDRGPRPARPLDFRHGSAVHQIRNGVPLSEVGAQLGHARADSTLIYLRLANPERRAMADRVAW